MSQSLSATLSCIEISGSVSSHLDHVRPAGAARARAPRVDRGPQRPPARRAARADVPGDGESRVAKRRETSNYVDL